MIDISTKLQRASKFAAAFVSLAVASSATAGTFTISPIRVELHRGHGTEVLTVRNEEDKPLLLQARAVVWSQENGEERYLDTRDLLLTPPVFQLAPKAEQIVRVAFRGQADASREIQYRVILTEVPQPSAERFMGLNVALSMSIPVFVRPLAAAQPDMKWKARWLPDGSLRITAENLGAAHLQVFDFDVHSGSQVLSHAALSRYVLPGSEIVWTLSPRKDTQADKASGATLTIRGNSDQGEFHVTALAEDS